jgi:hypothetical protein
MTKNKLRLALISALAFFCAGQVHAQENTNKNSQQHYTPSTGIRGGILGSLVYPGLSIGVERPYKYTQIDKVKPHKTKTIYRERYLSYSLGMYHQSYYHTNFLLQTEWTARRQRSGGLYYESSFGAGLSRTFVDGAVFSVTDDGEVFKVPLSGNWYALAAMGCAVGYNANLRLQKPFSIYLKHQWLLLFPYNSFLTMRPVITLGGNYNLSGFWEASPKYKHKEKLSRKVRKL